MAGTGNFTSRDTALVNHARKHCVYHGISDVRYSWYVAVTRARNTLVLNEQMLCLKAGEEQKDGGQPATDDMENDRGEAVFPC